MITFKEWMQRVNTELMQICGLSVDDIEDYYYRDEYDGGASPKEVALLALENSGFPLGEF